MFSVNGIEKGSVVEFRHDLLLNFSEAPLLSGTDRILYPAHVGLPYPIHPPLKTTETDPVRQLLEEKAGYYKLLETKRKRYKFDKKAIVKQEIANHEYVYLPRHMLEFYKKKDPDSHFKCDYNYYYTGGILEHLRINSGDYLITCNSENNLCVTGLRKPKHVNVVNSDCVSPIFSIKSYTNSRDALLILREKSRVNLVKLIGTTEVSTLVTSKFDVPVLDAELNPENAMHLGIVQCNRKLAIKDVETNRTIYSFKNDDKTDNFQQIQFFNANTLILMDRFTIKMLDYRTNEEDKSFDPHLLKCNSLCNLGILGNDIFLASRHYLLKTDVRFLKDFSYYSHMLNAAPCYMDFTTKSDDTYICLANQSQDGKVLFTGESPCTVPFNVPGIRETLKECRLRNPSLALMDNLENRLGFATAGLKVVNLDNDICIYSSNSLGEIFCQKVTDEPPESEKPVKVLFDWINTLPKPKPVLHLTRVEEMSSARFCLNTKPIESNLKRYKTESKAEEFLRAFRPRYSKKNVTSKLAEDFLSVWDDSEEDEEEDDDDQDLPELPSLDKVNDWIQTHDFSDDENTLGYSIAQNSSQ